MRFSVIILLMISLTSCQGALFATPIGKLVKDPGAYAGKEVTISGTVTKRGQMLLLEYFSIKDDSGEIVVIAHGNLPAVGDKVKVKGRVRETFPNSPAREVLFVQNGVGKTKSNRD